MRLGGYFSAETIDQLDAVCEKMDTYGLSAITAPWRLVEMSDHEAAAFGRRARDLGMVVGEVGLWQNMMNDDENVRTSRIETLRTMLKKADHMGCGCVVTTIGTKDPSDFLIAPHPYMYTRQARDEFREIVLRVLDGLDLKCTRYAIEPWWHGFFYQPEDILEFLDSVDHPSLGLHLDMMNMMNMSEFYENTGLINRTFDMLGDRAVSAHLKDIAPDPQHMFLKLDEVYIGDGVMDYQTLLTRLAALHDDLPCYCEHLEGERDYALNFARLHRQADKAGVKFIRRQG